MNDFSFIVGYDIAFLQQLCNDDKHSCCKHVTFTHTIKGNTFQSWSRYSCLNFAESIVRSVKKDSATKKNFHRFVYLYVIRNIKRKVIFPDQS